MTASRKQKTPSKYDSIIVTEYERYKEDCGLKIGDHKIFVKVIDRQDRYMLSMLRAHKADMQKMLSQGYDVQAVLITDLVREMLAEQKVEIKYLLDDHKKEIFVKIEALTKSLAEMRCVVNQTEEDIKRLKFLNSWYVMLIRGAGWTALAYMVVRWFHGTWNN